MESELLPQELSARRKKLKISQREVALHLKVTKSAISQFEGGKVKLSAENIKKYEFYLAIQENTEKKVEIIREESKKEGFVPRSDASLEKYLLSKIDNTNEAQVEQVRRYVALKRTFDELQLSIENLGAVIVSESGAIKANPAITQQKQVSTAMNDIFKVLGLEVALKNFEDDNINELLI